MTWPEIASIALYAAFSGLLLFGENLVHGQYHWVIAGYAILTIGLRTLVRLLRSLAVRREIIAFRSMDPVAREDFLQRLWPRGLRYEYERRIDVDEVHEVDGAVERFPFPAAERRLHASLFWATTGVGALPAAAVLWWPDLPFPIKAALAIVSGTSVLVGTWLLGRVALLSSRLEVSPFNVGIVWPGGRRVVVPFAKNLILQNFPSKGYFEVRAPDGSVRVRGHHARLASMRAFELIRINGKFEVPPDVDGAI